MIVGTFGRIRNGLVQALLGAFKIAVLVVIIDRRSNLYLSEPRGNSRFNSSPVNARELVNNGIGNAGRLLLARGRALVAKPDQLVMHLEQKFLNGADCRGLRLQPIGAQLGRPLHDRGAIFAAENGAGLLQARGE